MFTGFDLSDPEKEKAGILALQLKERDVVHSVSSFFVLPFLCQQILSFISPCMHLVNAHSPKNVVAAVSLKNHAFKLQCAAHRFSHLFVDYFVFSTLSFLFSVLGAHYQPPEQCCSSVQEIQVSPNEEPLK